MKLGDKVQFKNSPGYYGVIVAFYENGGYTISGHFAVVASDINPLTGPHIVIHTSLLEPAQDNGEFNTVVV